MLIRRGKNYFFARFLKGARNPRPRTAHAYAHAWFLRPYKGSVEQLLIIATIHIQQPGMQQYVHCTQSKNEVVLSTFAGASDDGVKWSCLKEEHNQHGQIQFYTLLFCYLYLITWSVL